MKSIILFGLILMTAMVSAREYRVMSFYRTNYYTHRTMVYDMKLSYEDCTIPKFAPDPVFFYFVHTNNGKAIKNDNISAQSKVFFTPKIISKEYDEIVYTFKAMDQVKNVFGQDIQYRIRTSGSKGKCKVDQTLIKAGRDIDMDLNRVEIKYVLGTQVVLGIEFKNQPVGIQWIKFIGKNKKGKTRTVCLDKKGKCAK